MKKSMLSTIALSLVCLQGGHAAHASAGPLDGITSQLIAENFPIANDIEVGTESAAVQTIAGCVQTKTFDIVENNASGQIIVAVCKDGEFGPQNIDAAFAKRVADAKDAFKNLPPPAMQFMLAGLDPIVLPLENGRQGKALTLPVVGHGFALIPFAYALTPGKESTIVIQAYLNPNAPRNLSKPIGTLLQGIDKRLYQAVP
ncbi:MAG: hypothetical protein AB1807_01590 [Pseudomonadota bacterium]